MEYRMNYRSPIGRLTLVSNGEALIECTLTSDDVETQYDEILLQAQSWLNDYFAGKNPPMNIPISIEVTPFTIQVLNYVTNIPYGTTCSYKDIARAISPTMSCRAVGQALRRNPLTLFIPCHRVIRKDGMPGGYFGDNFQTKLALIELERETL